MLVFSGDACCRYCSRLGYWLQSNWMFCWFYPPQLCRVCCWSSHGQSGSGNSTGFLLSYFQLLVLVGIGTIVCISRQIHVLVVREHECIYRRYHGVQSILLVKDHRNLIWCGGWFLFRHSRFDMYHHFYHWRHAFQYIWWKLAAIADSVDLFRAEDSSHWLDCSLSTKGWSRYLASCPCIFFLLSSASSLLIRADLMVIFRGNFLMAASCWISWPISSQYRCTFWWIDFSLRVTCQFDVSFSNCSSEFKRQLVKLIIAFLQRLVMLISPLPPFFCREIQSSYVTLAMHSMILLQRVSLSIIFNSVMSQSSTGSQYDIAGISYELIASKVC